MRETRINLKHLLADIRDSYNIPIEETIVVELIANSLDSSASLISFFIDPEKKSLTIVDNGKGMSRKELTYYHDIATTSKIRGKGIGFAGVGAKLSLLISSKVCTETKRKNKKSYATEWYLSDENRAPWNFVLPLDKIPYSSGTKITINIFNSNSPLFSEEFLNRVIIDHYFPFLNPIFFEKILRYFYKKQIKFFVNEKEILPLPFFTNGQYKDFKIFTKHSKKISGFGYLIKDNNKNQNNEQWGLKISTYGKVIKSGWEWIGISPQHPHQIHGIVEIPLLAEILTINKNDFLKDSVSLKKYYRYRKAIQEAIYPILGTFGEEINLGEGQKKFTSLTKEIEKTLRYVLNDFPELISLVGLKRAKNPLEEIFSDERSFVEILEKKQQVIELSTKKIKEKQKQKKQQKKGPGLVIGFEEEKDKNILARLIKNTVWINQSHPAYQKAKKQNNENYHILFCAAWVLSQFLEQQKSPQQFISNFLAYWAEAQL